MTRTTASHAMTILPRRTLRSLIAGAALLATLALAAGAQEQTPTTRPASTPARLVASGLDANGQINLLVNKSVVLTTTQPYKRVSVGQPDVADVNPLGGTSILVTAKKPGTTQLIVWDENEQTQVADIVVNLDVAGLQGELNRMFPGSKIDVTGMNGSIALRGKVANLQAAEQAVEVASPYAPKVMNFLEIAGGQQVILQVRFAEVSRAATTALGVNLGYVDGAFGGGSNIGQLNPTSLVPGEGSVLGNTPPPQGLALTGDQTVTSASSVYGFGQFGSFFFEYFLDALRQNNLLRVLAEPNLVTTSGQEAEFLAGGEFPIPVPQAGAGGNSTITIEYREFGVKLKFVPVVLGDGKIRLKVSPEVSDLDFTSAVSIAGTRVPGLRKRNLTTTVEMYEGQTFAVAGLLNQSVTAQKDVVPLLGDLPVLGVLFRSVRYQRQETELVVLVTPRIVSPMNPNEVPNLPGERWRHPSESDLFWNRDLGGPIAGAGPATRPVEAAGPAPRFHGQYGFVPVKSRAMETTRAD